MDNYDFIRWRESVFGLDRRGAARTLGIALNTLRAYEEDRRVPVYIALACGAISAGIGPWTLPPEMQKQKRKNPDIKPSKAPPGRQRQPQPEASK